MCGIYGYVGNSIDVMPLVSDALRTMEYRGYDSWGIGWDTGDRFSAVKAPGRVPRDTIAEATSTLAIGHTRWATHGQVTQENAHPHFDASCHIAVVHNGVIENAEWLRDRHLAGTRFLSETDSEIVPHLVRRHLDEGCSFPEAVLETFKLLDGSSAIVVANRATCEIAAITSRSPLRLGQREGGWVLASDPLALARQADLMAVVPDNTLLLLNGTARMIDIGSGDERSIDWRPIPTDTQTSQGAFPHFTLKEIHDQVAVLDRLSHRAADVRALSDALRSHRHIILTGCGSAYYAASLGAEWLSGQLDAWVDVLPASEIMGDTRNLGSNTIMVALTQSGETADVVDAIHIAKQWGATTATIVNTESSTVAGMVDHILPILAGTERSVLATKSFMAMAARLLQVTMVDHPDRAAAFSPVLPMIERLLEDSSIRELAGRISDQDHILTLGRHLGRPIAQEAALKIKEGSYVHAEAYLTGELKHGPLALVADGTPVILFATTPDELSSARIASREITSRGGFTIGVGAFGENECSIAFHSGDCGPATPLLQLVFAQLLAYEIAVARGVDPDFPRNLAKSVTVR